MIFLGILFLTREGILLILCGISFVKIRFDFLHKFTWACFRSLAQSKLRLCSANHRPSCWSNLPCDWPSTAWDYCEQETENGPRKHHQEICKHTKIDLGSSQSVVKHSQIFRFTKARDQWTRSIMKIFFFQLRDKIAKLLKFRGFNRTLNNVMLIIQTYC